jgi:hypothetical protein
MGILLPGHFLIAAALTAFFLKLKCKKAEEFQKFEFPAMEVVMSGLMDERELHIFQLMARMVEMVFNKRDEWDHDDVFLFGKLAKRFNILIEENVGLHACLCCNSAQFDPC